MTGLGYLGSDNLLEGHRQSESPQPASICNAAPTNGGTCCRRRLASLKDGAPCLSVPAG